MNKISNHMIIQSNKGYYIGKALLDKYGNFLHSISRNSDFYDELTDARKKLNELKGEEPENGI